MPESIIVAFITGLLTLVGTVITVVTTSKSSARKTDESIRTHQAVTDTKLEALTEEVRKHNGFAERIPVLEEKVNGIDRRLSKVESHLKGV